MMSPRIYIYKITFEEVLYYYYGVHKEKRYDEYYMGSPVTHKWVWDFYTPKKQILEVFHYSDDGWEEALSVEKRIIKEFYNSDQWCLNENSGGFISLEICRNSGKKLYEEGKGIHGRSRDQMSEDNRKAGKKLYEQGLGIHALTPEQRTENGKKGGSIGGKRGGKKAKELGVGIHAQTIEEKREYGRRGGKIGGKRGGSIIAEKYSKEFALISPEGEIVKCRNIRKFCRKHNLCDSAICRVLNGKLNHHKGWRKYDPDKITVLDFL
jgi:hypothetical protein